MPTVPYQATSLLLDSRTSYLFKFKASNRDYCFIFTISEMPKLTRRSTIKIAAKRSSEISEAFRLFDTVKVLLKYFLLK